MANVGVPKLGREVYETMLIAHVAAIFFVFLALIRGRARIKFNIPVAAGLSRDSLRCSVQLGGCGVSTSKIRAIVTKFRVPGIGTNISMQFMPYFTRISCEKVGATGSEPFVGL